MRTRHDETTTADVHAADVDAADVDAAEAERAIVLAETERAAVLAEIEEDEDELRARLGTEGLTGLEMAVVAELDALDEMSERLSA